MVTGRLRRWRGLEHAKMVGVSTMVELIPMMVSVTPENNDSAILATTAGFQRANKKPSSPIRNEGTMIKAIIWDIGGVLVKMEDPTPLRNWETQLGLPSGHLAKIIFGNPIAEQALIGQATPAEFWHAVVKQLDLSVEEVERLKIDFHRGGVWDTKLLAFIRSLKPHYKMGIISGAMLDAREEVQEYINYDLFDVIMFSAEEGIQKPDPDIYRRALSRLEVEANEAIFIDDWLASIEGARAVGLHVIQYTDETNIYDEISRLISEQA